MGLLEQQGLMLLVVQLALLEALAVLLEDQVFSQVAYLKVLYQAALLRQSAHSVKLFFFPLPLSFLKVISCQTFCTY